ncbi:MAG: cellulose synthase family protein, partial [Bacteroidota bacterium]
MIATIMDNMIAIGSLLIVVFYCVALILITVYCLMQFQLLYYYKSNHKNRQRPSQMEAESELFLPLVTIQLPIYNELHVVQRLLGAITSLDYPKDRLEIQLLDDSTDETIDISANEVVKYQNLGFDIAHIRRIDRQGYKAGALKSATPTAKGEFIAIFDADFLPEPDFLKSTMQYFKNDSVGVVQTRWEHLNQNYSLLTRVQAFQLNVHFTVEQLGRKLGNLLLQFNGTAGVWRKSTIEDAGGWEADTLTEDLDLSYRAQLKGWNIVYLEDVTSPAELPAEMSGLKSQQYRWMKGGAETAKKVLPKVWASDLSFRRKIHASIHLLGSTVFLAVFAVGFFSVPMALVLQPLGISASYFTIFLVSLTSIFLIYWVANVQVAWKDESRFKTFFKFVFLFPMFLA